MSRARRKIRALTLSSFQGQLRCFSCAMLMAYPGDRVHCCYLRHFSAFRLVIVTMSLPIISLTRRSYSDGVQQVKCPGCGTVNNTPPAETAAGLGGGRLVLSCFACESQVTCSSSAGSATCGVCTSHNEVLFDTCKPLPSVLPDTLFVCRSWRARKSAVVESSRAVGNSQLLAHCVRPWCNPKAARSLQAQVEAAK